MTSTVSTSPAIAGMMSLRNKIIPVLNLATVHGKYPDKEADRFIVLEFNQVAVGALVNSVTRIYRLSWERIERPSTICDSAYVPRLVQVIDRELALLRMKDGADYRQTTN